MIGRAIASVLANRYPNFELIIVDQSDTDETERIVRQFSQSYANLRYVHTTRVGLSAAYNSGIQLAAGELLAFTDDDCEAPPDWLDQIHRAFVECPDADLLYGQVIIPAELQGMPGVVPVLPIARRRRISRRTGFELYGMGANYAARRRLFTRIGGFDEVLGGGGPLRSSQDFDLQYRVYLAGLTTLLDPAVTVKHYGHRSAGEWPKTLTAYGTGNGGFFTKHVRCGDLYAGWLLGKELTREGLRCAIKPLLRRPHDNAYFGGMVRGIAGSFKFPIDRKHRMYVAS